MPRSFSLSSLKWKDPRVAMRAVLGVILLANLVAAGIAYQPTTWTLEPIEGSDTLAMMTINAGCQGTYAALSKFVNLVDKSPRFLIIESMVAQPQQTGQTLNVTLKVDTFVKEQGLGAPAEPDVAAPAAPGAPGAGI